MAPKGLLLGAIWVFCFLIFLLECAKSQLVPAVYVFGDSLVDVGNNNHLAISIAKANFPHNGVDFPTKKATGRFSNGKNAADFLAEKLGIPVSPPYLSLVSKLLNRKNTAAFVSGVSFASGGAGILNGTDDILQQSLPLTKQVEYYSLVHDELVKQLGVSGAQTHLSKSLFAIVIGSNDVFGYKAPKDGNTSSLQDYAQRMVGLLNSHINRIYSLGARKFVVVGIGSVGCCPAQRIKNKNLCNEEANALARVYNEGVQSTLRSLKSSLQGFYYSYFDTYSVMDSFIKSPANYGFAEVSAACCGLGNLNAEVPCLPIAKCCSNRKDHVFWDFYHPTEAAYRTFVEYIFDGSQKYTFPINVKQLVAI